MLTVEAAGETLCLLPIKFEQNFVSVHSWFLSPALIVNIGCSQVVLFTVQPFEDWKCFRLELGKMDVCVFWNLGHPSCFSSILLDSFGLQQLSTNSSAGWLSTCLIDLTSPQSSCTGRSVLWCQDIRQLAPLLKSFKCPDILSKLSDTL